MKSIKYKTKQRDMIIDFIKENNDRHFKAEEIILGLKVKGTPVSKATVYRNLDKLVQLGLVRKYVIEEGASACYQYINENNKCNNHYHLKCSNCGVLIHTECDYLDNMNLHILNHHDFKIDCMKTVLYGLCRECQRNNDE